MIWAILVVIPFMLQPSTSFSWSIFRSTSPKYLLQGYGMGQTFLLYGLLAFLVTRTTALTSAKMHLRVVLIEDTWTLNFMQLWMETIFT